MNPLWLFLVALWFALVSVRPAQAYFDPGAGSMMVQVLLGGSAAFLVALRLCWRRIVGLMTPGEKE
jgi:hypothetical protein